MNEAAWLRTEHGRNRIAATFADHHNHLALAVLIAGRGWKRILIVTSNYHARRARFILERLVPPGVSVHVSGARDSEFDPSRWWETRQGQKLFLSEVLGYAMARWDLRRKSDAPAGVGVLAGNFCRMADGRP